MKGDTCRLCGIKPEKSKYIFDEITNLAQIINDTLPIKVSQDDHSKYICLECYNKVISHYDFIQSVLAYSKKNEIKMISFFEIDRNEKLENVVISNLQSDMISTCPNCNKDLILLLKSNPEGNNYTLEILLAVVDQIEKLVEENSQISKESELSLNHDIVDKDVTNDNKQNINGIHISSQKDINYTNSYQKTDVSCEPNEDTKRKFQESVSTDTSINPTKLQKLEARLDVREQGANELNNDHDKSSITDWITFQSINNDIECLSEERENKKHRKSSTEYMIKRNHFDNNLIKSETETRLDVKEQDELSSDYDRSSVTGLITFQPENNELECLSSDTETKDDSATDVTKTERECINDANDINIPKSNLQCDLCGARYISQMKYKFHMERHKLNKIHKYVCLICDKEVRDENLLWDHYLHMHKNPIQYICSNCNRTFTTKSNLNEHRRIHRHSGYKKMLNIETDEDNQTQKVAIKKKRKCTVCRKLIKDNDPNAIDNLATCASCKACSVYLIVDGEAKVMSQRQYHCLKCRKHFVRQERLEFHEMRHNENMDEFICSTCGKEFSGENSLYEHYLFVHKGARPHVCEVCGKSFQLKARLKEHHRKHTGEKPYQCEICGLRCMTIHSLKFHKKSHFSTRHACKICGKSFIKKQNLNEHLEKHWQNDKNISLPQIFTCPLCYYDLPTFRMLKLHMIGIHRLDRQDPLIIKQKPLYECNECQEKFKHQMSLKAHKEKVHEGKGTFRTFQCDICKIEYKVKQLLINHIKSKHSGEKRYKCAQCNMEFANIRTLYRHITLHSDRKLFTCEYCNSNFRRKDAMDIHRCKQRMNNRPYQCTDCNKSFISYASRSNHRKKIHGDNETECSECGEKCGDMQEVRIHLNKHLGEKLSELKST